MDYFIYTLVAFLACGFGSLTGVGGGVIIKPIMDAIGDFSALEISIISSVTVFSMAVMSVIRQRKTAGELKKASMFALVIGAVAGGLLGEFLFSISAKNLFKESEIKLIQNIILGSLILIVFVYMLFSHKVKSLTFTSFLSFLITGLLLGIISAFLGIGGGPINVAILMFLFSFDIKKAGFSSILIILFAQSSKLISAMITTSFFSGLSLYILPFMVVAALVGAFVGSLLKKKFSDKAVMICFNAMQVVIIGLCVYNIVMLCI